jgi:hypothetical protein
MGTAAAQDEKSEGEKHPVKRNIPPSLITQMSERNGDGKIRNRNEGICDYVRPHQDRIFQIAICVRQEIGAQQPTPYLRPCNQNYSREGCTHANGKKLIL